MVNGPAEPVPSFIASAGIMIGIPHDFRMLEEIFDCKGGNYVPDNHYWASASIAELIAKCDAADRTALEARVVKIKKKYDEMPAVYQKNKAASDIPLK